MFQPDYRNILNSAKNMEARRLPLYEHSVSYKKIGEIYGVDLLSLMQGDDRDIHEFFRYYCGFFKEHGYDVVPFEWRVCGPDGIMPGGGALDDSRVNPAIQTEEDFRNYPWKEIPEYFFDRFSRYYRALRDEMPAGMRAVGGVGNGIFECVQDAVGYQNLCYMSVDDEEMYAGIFDSVGNMLLQIWERFMREFGDIYCVLRCGDDLGYKSNSLLSVSDLREHVFPKYKKLVDLIHSYHKPFLFHSCGNIFNLMDDLIEVVGIDAKHSNEDQIAPFPVWVEKYGHRIGNFGGLDVNAVCSYSKPELVEYTKDIIQKCQGHGGFAIGTGNSIPDYVPTENYLTMIEVVRELRGDFK